MRIRELVADDLEQIWRINQNEVPAVGSVSLAEIEAIAEQSMIALVATDEAVAATTGPDQANTENAGAEIAGAGDGEIAGFAMVLGSTTVYGSQNYRWFVDRYQDFIYLDRIAIAPPYQRRGLGRDLYSEVERLAAIRCPTANLFALEVNLIPRNDASLAFHHELGFREVGVRTPSEDYSVSMMTKSL